jgi:hypothetical protein
LAEKTAMLLNKIIVARKRNVIKYAGIEKSKLDKDKYGTYSENKLMTEMHDRHEQDVIF